MAVTAAVQLELGVWVTLPIGVDLGGAWHPGLPHAIVANLLALLPPDMTAVRFTFKPLLGSFGLDDVYVDPRARFWKTAPAGSSGRTAGYRDRSIFHVDGGTTDQRGGRGATCARSPSRGARIVRAMIDPLERWREQVRSPTTRGCSPSPACPTRRTPPNWAASTSRSWARRRTTSSPTGRARVSARARSGRPAARPARTWRRGSTRWRS